MRSTNSVTLLLLLATTQAVLTRATDCGSYGYIYTYQPPEDAACSPYNRGVLNLTCAVAGALVADIQCYFLSGEEGSQASILTNSSQVTITHSEFDRDYSEIMIVEGLTAANEGFYWCQGLVWHQDQIMRLSPSAMFQLRPIDRYVPFNCPNKALKSHAVRCARVIQLPMVSSSALPSSRQSSTFEVLLTSGESLSAGVDPSRTMAGHSFTISSTRLPTTRLFPTFQPTMTDNTIGGDGMTDRPPTGPFTDTSATTPQPPFVQGTIHVPDIIFYVILGLLGLLVVLVFSLSIVISIVCWKKHQGTTNQEMKCGVVENPAYDVVPVQGSAGDRLEPDFYNMKINPLYDTSIISDEGHSHKTEAPTDHVYESVDTL